MQSFYQQKGVGRRLIEYASSLAAERGVSTVIALSTRAADFFIKVCGFREGSVEDLPQARMESYQNEGRRSKILLKNI